MSRPNFHGLHRYATPRTPKQRGPQALQAHERIYKCECCNDTGVVQTWKLNKWAFPNEEPLNSSSTPVFCSQFRSCGDINMTVFAEDRDKREGESRIETLNLFNRPNSESTTIGLMIGRGQLKSLSSDQSRYIHDKVLEYRQQLSHGAGKKWVDECKARMARAIPMEAETGPQELTRICMSVEMPPEPQLEAPQSPSVEVSNPKDISYVLVGHTPAEADGPLTLEQNPF